MILKSYAVYAIMPCQDLLDSHSNSDALIASLLMYSLKLKRALVMPGYADDVAIPASLGSLKLKKRKEIKMKRFNWLRRVKTSQEKSPKDSREDLKLERTWIFDNRGNVSVSYKTPFYSDLSFGAEFDWIIKGFFKYYKDKSLDKGLALSDLFFKTFSGKKKKEAYPGLEFDIKSGPGCKQRFEELDKKVREFERRACEIFVSKEETKIEKR